MSLWEKILALHYLAAGFSLVILAAAWVSAKVNRRLK